jgi:hypothetical protein
MSKKTEVDPDYITHHEVDNGEKKIRYRVDHKAKQVYILQPATDVPHLADQPEYQEKWRLTGGSYDKFVEKLPPEELPGYVAPQPEETSFHPLEA